MSQSTNYRSLLTLLTWCLAREICFTFAGPLQIPTMNVSVISTLALMLSPAPVVWKSLMSWPIMCSRPYPRIFSAVWLHHTTWSITNIFFANQNIFWQNSQTERIKTDQETVETTCTRGGKGDKSGGQSIQRILREWIEMSEKVWDSRAKGWEVVPCVCCLWSGQCPCSCPALKTSHQLPVICPQIFLAWRKYFYHTTVRTWRPPWLARGPAGWARCSSRRGSGCPAPPGHSLILLIVLNI